MSNVSLTPLTHTHTHLASLVSSRHPPPAAWSGASEPARSPTGLGQVDLFAFAVRGLAVLVSRRDQATRSNFRLAPALGKRWTFPVSLFHGPLLRNNLLEPFFPNEEFVGGKFSTAD